MNLKFFRVALCCLLLVCCFGFFSFADTTDSAISEPVEPVEVFSSDSVPPNITVIVNNPDSSERLDALENAISSDSDNSSASVIPMDVMELQSVNVSTERISASDANGFKSVLLGLLGDYETIITDYTYSSGSGYTNHSIEITPDWSWIGSCAVFALVVWCFFRLVGGMLCSR